MTTRRVTPNTCARTVMETVPMVMRFIRGEMRRQSAPLLSVPQFRALAFLRRNAGACLFAVADHLGVSRPTASAVIDRLVRRGLVTRTVDPLERRRVSLRLTLSGSRHLTAARKATRAWMATMLAGMPEDRLRTIAQGVALLGRALTDVPGQNGN
ncbi:MAG TPA: MarR family winged helix-turn-helix transcriptional regulator [Candidatus Methylomirabilis sp.]|nr:MarR family winged helix-turn-helix transcriptional regulator [Candidatus Methylomirabilis sp.]HSC72278.1 MarR family winged helix-turn-helix transcriptional regulator [Candidatus Methylomirabilis sp.]